MPLTYELGAKDGKEQTLAGSWYASQFRVGQNAFEFKIDCGHETSEEDVKTVYFRVITNPSNAQQLFRLLGVALLRYSDAYGWIENGDAPSALRREE